MAAVGIIPEPWSRWTRKALDLLLPPRCPSCAVEVDAVGSLCGDCWTGLRFLAPPWCRTCGRPAPPAAAKDALCHECAIAPPPFDRARAALRYDDTSRRLVLAFKNSGRFEGLPAFAAWLARAGDELLGDADLILPVPLHRWRLVKRGFNQSAVLAQALAGRTGRAWSPDILRRPVATASQRGLGAAERVTNITSAAFEVQAANAVRVDGARIVLVDDVLTTGATLAACTAVLRQAGAVRIDVLTLARVVRDHELPI